MALITPAADAYHATAAVMIPNQPPQSRTRGAEDVAVAELPHTGEQLDEPTVEKRQPDPDQVRDERRVVPAQDEGRERERRESERRRVGGRNRLF